MSFIGLEIPEGVVARIEVGGTVIWSSTPFYDNELPIVWNSKAVANAKNVKVNGYVKISDLVPTHAEMQAAVLAVNGLTYSCNSSSENTGINNYTFGEDYPMFVCTDSETVGTETGVYVKDIYTSDGVNASCKLAIAIYDNELPITWNTVQVANAGNVTVDDFIKISNLTPTAEEMESLVITYVQDGETVELPYSSYLNERYVYTNESATAVVQMAVLDDGLYVGNYGSEVWNGTVWDVDFTASVVEQDTPTGTYDDEFPIEWNSLAVVEAGNTAINVGGVEMIKVSNLTPTAEEMASITLTLSASGYNSVYSDGTVDGSMWTYTDENSNTMELLLISDDTEGETGIYAVNFGSDDYGNQNGDFTLSLPAVATSYLYGHEAESTVSYNGVELPDIESVESDLPYACILYIDSVYYLWLMATALIIGSDEAITIQQYTCTDDAWVTDSELSFTPSDYESSYWDCLIWSNHDVWTIDGNTVNVY